MACNVSVRKDYKKISAYGYQRDIVRENDQMIRKFIKKCDKANILQDMRKHDYYVSPSLKKKLKRKEAAKRRLKEEFRLAKILAKNANSDKSDKQ